MDSIRKKLVTFLTICWPLYQIVLVLKPELFSLLSARVIHLGFGLLLVWFTKPLVIKKENTLVKFLDTIILSIFTVITVFYLHLNTERFELQPWGYTRLDEVISIVGILMVIEATRRVLGNTLVFVVLFFLSYGLFGNLIPGDFGHVGYSVTELGSKLFLTYDGIFGVVLGVSTSLIFIYLLFGGFLNVMGGGKFFTDLSFAMFGGRRGGPAKMAVISSCFFGSISGSAIANVVTTGTITIPLMKKLGYRPAFAGAVEAVSSTGGQFMPPVMGATAFIMAQMMGVTYVEVVKAACIPAILYFAAILFMVDFEAAKCGLVGMQKSELPTVKKVMREGWHYVIPFAVLIYLLVIVQWEAQIAGLYSIVAMVVVEFIRKPRWRTCVEVLHSVQEGARSAIAVTVPCAVIGIVVGVVLYTGVGLQFASLMRSFAGGLLLPILIVMMICSLVLGMGVPTTAAYILVAIMAVPSLVDLGVPVMSANLFAFYFAVVSVITPPVALAAYTAAGIAKADPMETGWNATKLGIAGFLVPFIFVYQPGLLLIGSLPAILMAIVSSLCGIIGLSGVLQNYFFGSINPYKRACLLICSLCMIYPGLYTDIIGFGGFGVLLWFQMSAGKTGKSASLAKVVGGQHEDYPHERR